MKILIIPVNYNSYKELGKYLESLQTALLGRNDFDVDVCIADNSNFHAKINKEKYSGFKLKVYQYPNLGYFGGALKVYNSISNLIEYDYTFISNVDVTYDQDFFLILKNIQPASEIGWLAPQIWSKAESRDRNPKIINRYSYKRIWLIELMWKYPILHQLYQSTLYKRKKIQRPFTPGKIYAGHGSFIILTNSFLNKYPQLHYPIFLFGEEIYLAELCLRADLLVEYNPNLIIRDEEHVSTSKMKSKFFYDCNYKAIKFIKDTFYE